MRVGIDASNLRAGGGVTHLSELLKAADPREAGIDDVGVWGSQDTVARLPAAPWLSLHHESALDGPLPSRVAWQQWTLHRRARGRYDLLFVPGGSYAGRFRPFVTMSRNLLPFEPGERQRYGASWMSAQMAVLRRGQAATLRRADGVIFLTAYARDVVTSVTGPLRGPTTIVPHGVSRAFVRPPRPQDGPERFGAGREFRLLYVSTIDMYKHQWHVAEAAAVLRRRGVPVTLELVGAAYGPALHRLQQTLDRVDPDGQFARYLGPVPHAALPARYHEADAFVFASSCENMPNILLEAMAAGLPIACAERGPMPSVLGDAGLYFDPEVPESIADAVEELYRDAARRADLAARAFRRANLYSWERCAHETWTFLARVGAEAGAAPS
jgi:glycosyltransferase involved in cell wall biosynthesis